MNKRSFASIHGAKQMERQKIGLTIEDSVVASGIGRTKIFEAIKMGRLPARKAGRRTIILASDLEAFLSTLPMREVA